MAPWQRGDERKHLRPIKRDLPKTKEMDTVTDQVVDQYVRKLTSPKEVFKLENAL